VQGLKRLLHEGAGMSLEERSSSRTKRATWLLAGTAAPGQGFFGEEGERA